MNEVVVSKQAFRVALTVVAVSLLLGCTGGDDSDPSSGREGEDGELTDRETIDDGPIDSNDEADSMPNNDAGEDDDKSDGSPLYEDAVVDPDRILVEPDIVAPGETANVFFPEESKRSVYFALERDTGDGWNHVFHLNSGEEIEGGSMGWGPADDPDYVYPGVAVHGPGPDVLPIPESAAPGVYRICSRVGEDDVVCAELTVED